jgi:hypothetical protein
MKSSIEIQEIEIKNKLTGNLREDVKSGNKEKI